MAESALRSGLDGIVLTEHDVIWPKKEVADLQRRFPKLVILTGVEISLGDIHILVYGAEDLSELAARRAVGNLAGSSDGGKTFWALAHPFRYDNSFANFSYLSGFSVDAVEIASNNTLEGPGRMADRLADTLGVLKIAGSDAHSIHNIGKHYTIFDKPIKTITDLVSALGSRECRPASEAYGEEDLPDADADKTDKHFRFPFFGWRK